MTSRVAAALVCVLVGAFAGCSRPTPPTRVIEFSGPTMGTTWSVKLVPPSSGLSSDDSRSIDGAIRDELARFDRLLSTWNPDSELSRFNVSTELEPFSVAPETFAVFQHSLEIWKETGGAFDPTLGPLIDAWGFGTDRSAPAPDDATVERLRAEVVGMSLVELDPDGAWVRKRASGVRCEFSAIAPGYAADLLGELLLARGIDRFLVDISGELVGRGLNDRGVPWQVGIERPQMTGRTPVLVVDLRDMAMATSGDYRNFREVDGQRLTHILDPRSGRPVHHTLASVTVFDPLAVRADALATGLMVMGPDEAPAFAEKHGIPAVFLIRAPGGSFEEKRSSAFDALQAGTGASAKVS